MNLCSFQPDHAGINQLNSQRSLSLQKFPDWSNLTPNYRAGEPPCTEGGLKGCLKHHGLRCLCREHCAVMCNVGRFLWDVDSLWEMHVGGTGLRRPGGLIFFFFPLSLYCLWAWRFLGFGLFCWLFKPWGRKSFWFWKNLATACTVLWATHSWRLDPVLPKGCWLSSESSNVPFFFHSWHLYWVLITC